LSSAAPAVALTGIARRFGSRWVLKGADLTVRRGETVAILGKNGSGKTTLLRIIATLLRASRGSGSVFGHDLGREADAVRSRVGLLGHTNAVYPDLTAAENLGFTLRMLGRPVEPRSLQATLDLVGLGAQANARARGFSAGMQRRLSLARLRMLEPELLLLDEPYSSLDPEGAELVTMMIAEGRDKGGGAIVITHDARRATQIANRVVAIADGRIAPWTPGQTMDVVDTPSPARSESR
jgi:heme exporter protein A